MGCNLFRLHILEQSYLADQVALSMRIMIFNVSSVIYHVDTFICMREGVHNVEK